MTHDSRRYHRPRHPTFTRGYGMLAELGSGVASGASAVGSGLESAAGAAGPLLEKMAGSALGPVGKTALSGIENVGQGLQSLFTSGGGEAGKLAALGQAVPAGVDLLGPSSTFAGPGFLSSVYQGFIGAPQHFANPSAATSAGTGVGQLLDMLQQMQAQGGGPAKMPPIVTPGPAIRPPQVIPAASGMTGQAAAPIMSLLHI
jgi:type VI secretion system secreted protein VgrG